MMEEPDREYPLGDFTQNVGYGTAQPSGCLDKLGSDSYPSAFTWTRQNQCVRIRAMLFTIDIGGTFIK